MPRILAYSRPGADDTDDLGHFEYNGSFSHDLHPKQADSVEREAWAKMMDCFQEVIFVVERECAVAHRRTWENG